MSPQEVTVRVGALPSVPRHFKSVIAEQSQSLIRRACKNLRAELDALRGDPGHGVRLRYNDGPGGFPPPR